MKGRLLERSQSMVAVAMAAVIVLLVALSSPATLAKTPTRTESRSLPTGQWEGFTKGGRKVELVLAGGGLTDFRTLLGVECYSGKYVSRFIYPLRGRKKSRVVPIGTHRNFRKVFRGAGRASLKDNTRTLTGSLRQGKIRGLIRIEGICRGHVAFSARRVSAKQPGGS